MFGWKQKQQPVQQQPAAANAAPPQTTEPVRLNDYVVDGGNQPTELESLGNANNSSMSFITPQYGYESSSQKSAGATNTVQSSTVSNVLEHHEGADQPSHADDFGERAMLPLEETDGLVATNKPNSTAPKKKKTKRPQKREDDGADLPSKHDYQSNILQKHGDGHHADVGPKIDPTIADDNKLRSK